MEKPDGTTYARSHYKGRQTEENGGFWEMTNNSSTALPIGNNLSVDERLKILANLMVDRILEEEKKYQERLKTDPSAKRIYETCTCEKCTNRRTKDKK